MLKTMTLRIAASTLLAFSVGVALAAAPADHGPATNAAGDDNAILAGSPTGTATRLPRPRKLPSSAAWEFTRPPVSDKPTGRERAAGTSHDRFANAETS